jgi:hypothetical protein
MVRESNDYSIKGWSVINYKLKYKLDESVGGLEKFLSTLASLNDGFSASDS